MSTVFVSNMMPYVLKLIANNNEIGALPAAGGPGQAPQPSAFSFSNSGGSDFGPQNSLELWSEMSDAPQIYQFGIDPNLDAKVDVQIFVYQGFLTLMEPSGVHMVTAQPAPPQPD